VTSFFEQAHDQALIYSVIFRNENREALAGFLSALHERVIKGVAPSCSRESRTRAMASRSSERRIGLSK
jgi:hypothetical protein